MAGTVNITYIKREFAAQARQFRGLAKGAAAAKLENAKRAMLQEFENHPVTQEIESGPEGINESNTLGGYGNLYSYIGFDAGDNPTEIVKEILQQPNLGSFAKSYFDGNTLNYDFRVTNPPIIENIERQTPMPGWDSGRSWVTAIERGISGLGHYLFARFKTFPSSRSGPAIQTQKQVRGGRFRNVSYLSGIVKRFYERLVS